MNILILNGVNLNMTGRREKGVYGTQTLREINDEIARYAEERGVTIKFFQNNVEGEICTAIQSAEGKYDGIILNAGAFTHYSYAIREYCPLRYDGRRKVQRRRTHCRVDGVYVV